LLLKDEKRVLLVERYHRRARIKLPNIRLHAVFHVIIENQFASNNEPAVRAVDWLTKQGHSRHDAIHAIGSVLSGQIYERPRQKNPDVAGEVLRAGRTADCEGMARWPRRLTRRSSGPHGSGAGPSMRDAGNSRCWRQLG
jgi:hypothetical protein